MPRSTNNISSTTVTVLHNNRTPKSRLWISPILCRTYKRLQLMQIFQSSIKTLSMRFTTLYTSQVFYTTTMKNRMTNDYSEKMDHISSIFDQGTAKSKTFTETNTNHNGFHIASTISQDHTEQEIYSLINMETTVAEDKDIIKTQLKKIVNQMTKTTDLMAPMKARDM